LKQIYHNCLIIATDYINPQSTFSSTVWWEILWKWYYFIFDCKHDWILL